MSNTPSASQPLPTIGTLTFPPNPNASSNLIKVSVPMVDDCKQTEEYTPEYRETFSKNILKQRINEFEGGKYTRRYMETYLDFVHMSGMISNLDYLEFKGILKKGE
jgi:hypothetical protein